MDLDLADRVALIGGSSRGIGFAIARAFLQERSRVAITGRDENAIRAAETTLAAEFGADRLLAVAGDLGEEGTRQRLLDELRRRWGSVDCLVGNVGTGQVRPGWNAGEDEWQQALTRNLATSRRLAETVLPEMLQSRRGSIVFTASIAGLESIQAPLAYSTAKAALISYSKSLAHEVGPHGVRVNCVAPGNILFRGGSWERKLAEKPEEFRRYIEREVPLRRFGSPEEVANVVTFLSSDRASFVTGACFVADGGQTRSF